jgi:RNA polymerase sigma factor (sigma-70 family)
MQSARIAVFRETELSAAGGRTLIVRTLTLADQMPSDSRSADADVLARISMREADAMAELYDRYSRRVFSLARRITTDPTLAEDVVQEVFLTVWRAPDSFVAARGSFGSWLLAMTHHKAVDVVRREETRRRHRSEAADEEAVMGPTGGDFAVDEQVFERLRAERVRDALGSLPEPQRKAIALAYFGGYTQREVAALTDTPLGTVKTRMFAGMRRLRGILEGVAELPPAGPTLGGGSS